MPEVWVSRFSRVILWPWVGKSGRYLVMSSVTLSLPRSWSSRIDAAVNCLVTEPSSNTISGEFGTPSSRLAIPYPLRSSTLPSLTTIAAAPGWPAG